MNKPIPTFSSDAEAEAFIDTADLTAFDLSGAERTVFELRREDTAANLRLPEQLLKAVRSRAEEAGISCQRYIRMALERVVQEPKP